MKTGKNKSKKKNSKKMNPLLADLEVPKMASQLERDMRSLKKDRESQ